MTTGFYHHPSPSRWSPTHRTHMCDVPKARNHYRRDYWNLNCIINWKFHRPINNLILLIGVYMCNWDNIPANIYFYTVRCAIVLVHSFIYENNHRKFKGYTMRCRKLKSVSIIILENYQYCRLLLLYTSW